MLTKLGFIADILPPQNWQKNAVLRAINLNGVSKATPKAVAVIQIKMHHADQASQEKGSTLRPPLKSLSKNTAKITAHPFCIAKTQTIKKPVSKDRLTEVKSSVGLGT